MKYLIIHRSFGQNQLGYYGTIPEDAAKIVTRTGKTEAVLEYIFAQHNVDDRPDRFLRPSLSSDIMTGGDYVVLFHVETFTEPDGDDTWKSASYECWRCAPLGWKLTPTPHWEWADKDFQAYVLETIEYLRRELQGTPYTV